MEELAAALVISTLILCTCGVELRHKKVEPSTIDANFSIEFPEKKSIPEILGLDKPEQ